MSGSASGDIKSLVLASTDIVELIGRTVALKKSGKELVGLCPFHQEKTPSFYVNPAKQVFVCRGGCHKGGNAIDFVMLRDRVEFLDALRTLAEAANIPMPSRDGRSKENAGERQALLSAQSTACMLFEKLLSHPSQGEAARAYLARRGFNAETIARFRLGLAAEGWDALVKSPAMRPFSPQQLVLAGLAKARDRGEGYYDTFRNRLIFPIRNESGQVIAFGGRRMLETDEPKYLNSPETMLFSKSRCVYGLDLARDRIVETRSVTVVEGYTDVVMAHQFGITNVVSVLGTALTEQHVSMLRRFADRIVLLFDPDRAGVNAADRALELFLRQPVEIAIATLPDGLDPDEYLLKHGAQAFEAVLSDATDALAYKWKQFERRLRSSDALTDQQHAIEQYLQTLAKARGSGPVDPLRWGAALARVSRLTEIPVDQLNHRFALGGRRAGKAGIQAPPTAEPNMTVPAGPMTGRQRAEGYILGLLLSEPQRWHAVQRDLRPADFAEANLRKIAEVFWQHQQDEGEPVLSELLGLLDDPELKALAMHWSDQASATPNADAALEGCLRHLVDLQRQEEQRKLIARLQRTATDDAAEKAPASHQDGSVDEVDVLRQLQEKARQPDLKRLGI